MKFSKLSKNTLAVLAGTTSLMFLSACSSPQTDDTTPADSPDATSETQASDTAGESGMGESDALKAVLAENESLSTLSQALDAANLGEAIDTVGEYTLFAPTNDAFNQLPEGTLDALLLPENQDTLAQILKYHIVLGEATVENLKSAPYETAYGEPVEVSPGEGTPTVKDATITETGIQTENGIVHTIDKVLLPPDISLSDLQTGGES